MGMLQNIITLNLAFDRSKREFKDKYIWDLPIEINRTIPWIKTKKKTQTNSSQKYKVENKRRGKMN